MAADDQQDPDGRTDRDGDPEAPISSSATGHEQDEERAKGHSVPKRTGTAGQHDDPDAPGMGVIDPEEGWPEPNEPA